MKIQNVLNLATSRFLNMFAVEYEDRTGKTKIWNFVSRLKQPKMTDPKKFADPDAVLIVPYHVDGGIVVIREFRVPLAGSCYDFPAGLVDPGETVEDAAKRELFEETGLKIENILEVSPPVYASPGLTDETITLVYAKVSGEFDTSKTEASEDITPVLMNHGDVQELIHNSDFKVGKAAWPILYTFANSF